VPATVNEIVFAVSNATCPLILSAIVNVLVVVAPVIVPAVMLADMWHYEVYKYGLHRGKMPALRQIKSIPNTRDFDKDGKTDVVGNVFTDIIYMNFHGSTYNFGSSNVSPKIGGWSEGCQVVQKNADYERIIKLVKNQHVVSYCLINEF
jgi:hypothetical protein